MEFRISNLMHSALVSIRGNAEEMYVHVQLINSFFKKIFGVEHIRFCSQKDKLVIKEGKHPFVYELARLVNARVRSEILTAENNLRAI